MELADRARVLANKSMMNQKHACIVVHGNTIIAEGYNQTIDYFSHSYSLHAEVVAISKLKPFPKSYLRQCKMYVFRISNTNPNIFRMSKPCLNCQRAIIEMEIGKVYYSCDM